MTVVDWNESGGLNQLSSDQQIECFKEFAVNRLWNEADFSQLFSEYNQTNGQCIGSVIVGGQILKLTGCFEETTKGFIVTALEVECKHGSTATPSQSKQLSTSENVVVASSNIVISTSEQSVANSSQISESIPDSSSADQCDSNEPSKNTRDAISNFREREKTSQILLFLKNNYDSIINMNRNCFKIHSYEEYKTISSYSFPFIYKKSNQFFIMYDNESKRQIASSLGAKLLLACNDSNKKSIEMLLDTSNTKNILLDLRDFMKNVKSEDERIKALRHISFDESLNELNSVNTAFMK